MEDLWTRLETFANEHQRSLQLRPGASEKEVARAEKALGRKLPSGYRQSVLLHDGQENDPEAFGWMPGCWLLAPLKAVVAFHATLENLATMCREEAEEDEGPSFDTSGTHRLDVFHEDRIPIAGYPYWDGDNTFLDFAVGPNGTDGQVLGLVTECDFEVYGTSFEEAVGAYVAALESGDWIYDEALGKTRWKGRKKRCNGGTEFAKFRRSQ